jgi:hypothetical protein
MDAKARFSSLSPRIQGISLLAPLLFLAVSLLLSCPALGEENWLLDLPVAQPRFIGGEWFEAGSLIDIDSSLGRENEAWSPYVKVWLIGPNGTRVHATIQKVPEPFVSFPWNSTENNLACDGSSPAGAQVGYVFLALLALPTIVLPFFAAKGRDDPRRYWWFIASFLLLLNEWNMIRTPQALSTIATDCREARAIVAAHANYYTPKSSYQSGTFLGLLPFHASEAVSLRNVKQNKITENIMALNLSWEFLLLFILAFQIPAAVSGAHYVFVKHPVEPFLKTKGPEDRIPLAKVREILSQPHGNPGPEFVEDNQARRVEAQTKRMEAEARLAEALLERERARERRKRAQDD